MVVEVRFASCSRLTLSSVGATSTAALTVATANGIDSGRMFAVTRTFCACGLNSGTATSTRYSPTARSKEKLPVESDCPSMMTRFPWDTLTAAPGITAPEGSNTVPRSRAVCALTTEALSNSTASAMMLHSFMSFSFFHSIRMADLNINSCGNFPVTSHYIDTGSADLVTGKNERVGRI